MEKFASQPSYIGHIPYPVAFQANNPHKAAIPDLCNQ